MDHVLSRTGQPPLRIAGRLLARSDSRERAPRNHPRWYAVAVYAIDDPAYYYAVQIIMRTAKEGEQDHHRVILCRARAGVAEALRTHNPLGFLKGSPLRNLSEARLDDAKHGMYRAYQDAVRNLYDLLGPEWAETPATDGEQPRWHVQHGDRLLTRTGSWALAAAMLSDRRDLLAFWTHQEALAGCEVLKALMGDQASVSPFCYD